MFDAIGEREGLDLAPLLSTELESLLGFMWASWEAPPAQRAWRHLAYAALWERAGVTRVFGEVVRRCRYDRLAADASAWLDTTMRLWFSPTAPLPLLSLRVQGLDQDDAAVRRAWYDRVLGPLAGTGGAGRGNGSAELTLLLDDLLGELRTSIEARAAGTSDRSDEQTVTDAVRRLGGLLRPWRHNASYRRAEFASVALAGWFDVTLRYDAPILRHLGADGTTASERLLALAERLDVDLDDAQDTISAIESALPLALLLEAIEDRDVDGWTGADFAADDDARAILRPLIRHRDRLLHVGPASQAASPTRGAQQVHLGARR